MERLHHKVQGSLFVIQSMVIIQHKAAHNCYCFSAHAFMRTVAYLVLL